MNRRVMFDARKSLTGEFMEHRRVQEASDKMNACADPLLKVPSRSTARIQEVHIFWACTVSCRGEPVAAYMSVSACKKT